MNSYSVVRPLSIHTTITPTARAIRLLKKAAFFVALCGVAPGAWAQLYWDSNGFDLGAGATPTGIWGTDGFWNTLLDGTGATGAWTPGELAIFSAGTDAAGPYTVTVTGTQTGTGVTLEEGDLTLSGGTLTLTGGAILNVASGLTMTMSSALAGSVGWTKSGSGTLVFTANSTATGSRNIVDGIVSINSSLRIPASGDVTLNGGTLRQTNPLSAGSFIPAGTALVIGPNGGTVNYTCPGAAVPANSNSIYSGTITGPGNTLTKTGPSEFRYQGTGLPNTTYAKLVVNEGLFRLGFNSSVADERGFGAVPAVPTADAITLNGGAIGGSFIITNHPNRGITLGLAGGSINTSAGEMIVAANITGPGALFKNTAGNLTLLGQNDFADNFTINNGGVRFNSDAAAGAGTVVVTPTGTVTLRNLSPTLTSTLTNPITLNANGGFDIDLTAAVGNTFTISGPISGSGYMTRGRATGAGGIVVLSGDNSGWSGGLYLHRGIIGLGHKNALGSAPFSITPPTNATPDFVTVQAAVPLTGANAVANLVIVNTNVTLGGVNDLEVSGGVWLSNVTRTITVTNNSTFSGVVSGDAGAGLVKAGAGTLTLAAANNYSGDTVVSGGTLRVANVTGSATGAGLVTVEPGATLTGPGSVAGTLTVNGTVSPGASPGTQNTGSEVWNGGGSYLWEINDVDAGQGTDPGWDLINITGGLTINATAGSKFNINITSLTLGNVSGDVHDFNNTVDYTWTVLKTTMGITGFDPAAFNLTSAAFSNAVGPGGTFLIETANGGNDLVVRFVRVPTVAVQPVGGTVECSSMFLFSVSANGSAPLSYQWKHAGTNLPGATASTLAVTATAETAGTYAVEITNPYGVVTSDTVTLTVVDTTPPMIVCAPNATVECGSAWDFTAPTATDTCDANPTIAVVSTVTNSVPGGFAATRTWQATDASLNNAQCSQTITELDTTAPMIACPSSITAACTNAGGNVVTYGTPTATDVCDPAPTVVCVPASGSTFPAGTTLVTCTATDAAGNTNACTFSVTISDTTAPAIVCPPNVVAECGATGTNLTGTATATDGCDTDVAIAHTDSAATIVTATSPSGWALSTTDDGTPPNTAIAEFVGGSGTPLGGGSARLAVGANGSSAAQLRSTAYAGTLLSAITEFAYSTYRTVDGSGGQMPYIILNVDLNDDGVTDDLLFFEPVYQNPAYNPALPDQGLLVTGAWQRWDARAGGWWSLNSLAGATPGAGVKSLATYIAANPGAKVAVSAAGAVRLVAGFGAGAWDNFDGNADAFVIAVNNVTDAFDFELSTPCGPADIARVWSATDDSGNVARCTQLVKTVDTAAPQITCPANIIACTSSNSAVVGFSASATDSCDNAPMVVCTPASGSDFVVGVTMVTCDAYDACGNTNTCTFSVTVNQETTVTGLANATVCPGASATFGPVTPAGTGPFAFQWTKDDVLIDGATSASYTVASAMAGNAGTYCVIATGTCNSATNCATLMLHTPPAVAVNSPTICSGGTATLTATTDASNPGYLWSPGGETTASIMVSPTSTTTYMVTVTDGTTTCSASASGTVTVNPLPTVAVNSPTICAGQTATLTATTDASNPSYLWSPGGETAASIMVSPTSTTTYMVTVTDGTTTCSKSASGTVTVNPLPTVAVNSETICTGGTTTLTATTDASSPSYVWSPGGETTASIMVSPTSTTTYTVTVTDGTTTCSKNASGTVTVNPLPVVTVNSATICPGDSATLTATTGASSPTYLWSPGGATTASIMVSPTVTTTYTVTVTDGTTTCSESGSGTVIVIDPVVFANSSAISITDNATGSPYPSTIAVSGVTTLVCKVTVSVSGLSHTWPDDIDLLLVGPGGQSALLMSDAGGGSALSGMILTFDDAAATPLPDETIIATGTYQVSNFGNKADSFPPPAPPTNYASSLSVFDGTNPNGTWSLYVIDDEAGDLGQISGGWSLSISGTEPFADIAVAKADLPDPVATGSNLTYTVIVTNQGPASAEGVTLADILPGNVTYVSSSASQGSCLESAGTVNCTIGTIGAGQAVTVTVAVIPTVLGAVTNSVTIASTTTDLDLANNSATSVTTVLAPPVITVQPASATVCPGEMVTFTVTATGEPPLLYQWRKGGVDLTGETGSTLTINSVQLGDAGSYDVRVSNVVGSTLSDPATLTVLPPTSATPLVNITNICPGITASFSTTASGTGPFSYVWRKDGAELTGETGNSLSFTVTASSGGTYCVEVTGMCSSVTNCATLTVAQAPTIATQPQNFNGVQGNSATFGVVASGTGPFAYQWRYNGANLSNGGQVAGATTTTLTLSSLNCTNEGSFDVIVNNCSGSVTSLVAVLAVRPITAVYFDFETIGQFTNNLPNNGGADPLVPIPFEAAGAGVGGGRGLDLLLNSGTVNDSAFPAMPYDFSVNGRVLRASVMFKLKAGANNVNDTVMMLGLASKASRLDSGDEQVAFAGVKILGQGAVAAAPATGYQMQLRNKVFAGTAVGTSNATANATLVNGNWYKLSVNFTNIKATVNNAFRYNATLVDMGPNGTTAGATVLFTSNTNVINADLVNDTSVFFDIRMRENAGLDFIDQLSINTADGAVFFACQPRSQTVVQGRPVTINAYIDGTPPFAYQWLKDGVAIPGATDWQYKIPAASAADAGDYRLQVSAGGPSIVSDPATLTVTSDATGPVLVSAGSFDGCTVGLCFDEPLDCASATTAGNYSVSGASIGFVQLRPDRKSVILHISPAINGAFSVTVNGVQDIYGNTITAGSSASGNVASHLSSLEIGGPLPSVTGNDAIYSCKDGDFDITAGGADVWGNSDQFRFTHQTRTGDFDVRVKIAGQTIPNTVLKAGLMVRENIDAASRTMHAIVNPPWPALDRYETGQRTAYAGTTVSWGVGVANGNRAATPPSSWLRMRRVNNTFTAYAGSNGVDWVAIGQTTQFYPPTVLVGLEMVSHVQGRLGMTEFRSYGDFGGYPGAVINITTHPASTNINAGQTASFMVAATVTGAPASELQYQWQRSDGIGGFTNIPSANAASASFATPALFGSDSSAAFRCVVRVAGVAGAASNPAVVTVADAVAPTLLTANVLAGSLRHIVLVFSEPVSPGTADVTGNYNVATLGGTPFTVANATFFGNANTIVLTTDTDLFADEYRVVINNVQDLGAPPNTIAANTTRAFRQFAAPLQPVVIEMFEDIGNNGTVANLQGQAIYSQGQPTYISYSNIFGHNVSLSASLLPGTSGTAQDQYGIRAYTHFVPPTNGNYKFWIRGDDGLQLWMNTNGANGARSAVIASSTNHPAAEVAANAIDNLSNTKYLNFDEFNTGFTVTPVAGSSVVTGMRFTTANDAADRDPMTFRLEGTTGNPQVGPWTVIVPETSTQLTNTLARLTVGPTVPLANATAYTSYRIIFPTVRTNATANSMQIAEVEFLDASGRDVTDSGIVLIAENAANAANYGIGSTPANSKTNIALVGGQRYFLEALLREGQGGDGFSVMWTDSSVTTAPANTTFIPASALAYPEGSAPPTPVIAELYTGPVPGATFGGSDLASLGTVTNHAKWGNAPDVLVYQKYFAMQPQLVNTRFDNYGGRIYSYFTAPSNGLYRFYLRSDDSSQLYMNTNAVNSTDPAGMVLLGQLTAFTGAFTLVGQNVPLNGGQSYYIEARWKEGTGGDGIAMTFRAQSDTTPPPTVPIPELASPDWFGLPNPPLLRMGPVGLTGINPSSPVLSEGQTVTLAPAGLSGAQPYSFTWLKNGAFVADSVRYTTLPATPADHGAVYTLIVSNAFSRAQASATVTVNVDTTAPAIVNVSSHSYLTNVIVTFSEPIKQATALNAGNYQIAGLTVLGAYTDASLRRLSLLTSPQTPGAPYVLMASGLTDNSEANNPLAPASVPFNAWQATGCEIGSLQVELFTNMTGVAIANLTSDGRYINNLADSFSAIREFQWTSVPPLVGNGMENYGVRISGHFIPPSNGVYRFYIRSDDASQLFLNSNPVNSTDPAGKALIAREDTCCKAYGDTTAGGPRVSAGIPLNGGQRYYIEGLLKEGGGGDFFQMAWREAGDPATPPNNENASGQFFALPPNPVDTTPPQVVRTYSLSGNSVIIEFNEALDATLDLSNPNMDPFNFYIDDGLTVVNAIQVTVRRDGRSLLLDIPQIGAASYTIQIDNVRDQHCNTMPSTTVPGVVFALAQGLRDNTDVGAHNTNPSITGGTAPMVNPASPGSASAVSPNNLTIIAGGTDIWDNADGMHFAYGLQTGDFDVRVRVESLAPRNRWSKAGLMLRENLSGGSRNINAVLDPAPVPALDGSGAGQNTYEANKRDAQNGGPTAWSASNPTPVPYPNAWIRLRRIGDTFLAYASSDGVNWVQYGSTAAAGFSPTALLGLATTAHNNTFAQTTTAIYHDYGFILPPTIVDQPDSVAVVSGETASFSVVAGGTAPFSYQWRFNGGNIANETNATLTINTVTVANAGNYDVVVSNMNSSVTSDVAVLTVLVLDFGDAPAPYPTLSADNGARHVIVPGFHLGASTTDSEATGQPSVLADGDDTNGTDDEDGVESTTPFIRGQTASVDVAVTAAGKLDAWIDYNRDGDWADAGERVANNVPLVAGVNTLPLAIPAAASDGPTYARLRLSSVGELSYDGLAQDGEVEDYIILIENTAPIARNDGFGTITNAPRTIAASALLANDTDANGDTLSVAGVSSSSMQGGTVALVGAAVTYTPPANFTGADFFTYTISDGHGGTATATVCITVNIANLAYAEPSGGWAYVYDGATDAYGVGGTVIGNSALDGNWTHGNGSDSWAEQTTLVPDRPGAGNGLVGGVGSVTEADAGSPGGVATFLRVVDGITAGSTASDNRRFYFMRDLSTLPGYTPTFMNSGITITFRARLVPDAALEGALTAANKGGMVGADGKGMFGFRQASGDQIVTFSLHTATEDGAPTPAFSNAGLTLNKNVADAPSNAVGNPSSAAFAQNDLALDPNAWHEFWITVQANDATPGNGTHTATIYMDGSQTPAGVFNFTAGNGDEGTSTTPAIANYLELGQNFTPLTGAFDTDFYGVRMGAVAPGGFNDPVAIVAQPANATAAEGATASFSVGVSGTAPYFFQWFDNGVPIANATNSTYTHVAACADNGHGFHVVVSNFCSQATSTAATLSVTSAVPALRITRQGSDVVIAWPVTCDTFIVQESISLQPGNTWSTASGAASTVGNEHRLTIPISPTENRFYRLQRP